MTDEVKYIDPREFRDLGFLQELNRQFLHPLGLALSVRVVEGDWSEEEVAGSAWMRDRLQVVRRALEATVGRNPDVTDGECQAAALRVCAALWSQGSVHFADCWDYREDPEGMVFGEWPEPESTRRGRSVDEERLRHRAARLRLFDTRYHAADDRLEAEPPDVEPIGWEYPSDRNLP